MRAFDWQQGQHVTFLGTTGSGKTTFALNVLEKRTGSKIVLATKRKDEQLDALKRRGYREIRSVQDLLWDHRKHLFRPVIKSLTDTGPSAEFRHLLNTVFDAGYFTVYADEVRYLTDTLRLRQDMQVLWLQGRALRITIVAGTQRPAWIPLEAYSQATHLFFWRTKDRRDLDRVSDISGGIDRDLLRREIRRLPRYEALYVNTDTDQMFRTKVPKQLVKTRR